ncbi:hypothetical protein ACOME3_005671 [Neoechinorhynchus agilis]
MNFFSKKSVDPIVISTWDFPEAAKEGYNAIHVGGNSLDAVVQGCSACESNPERTCVGKFGKTDESGEVSLDAMVMDGRSMRAGAVGCLRRIEEATKLARTVMERTKHSFLVGEDATKFALEMGFKQCDLKSDYSTQEYKKWLTAGKKPNFRQDFRRDIDSENHDTIGVIALDKNGDIAVGCSTNGLQHKIPGRVGDTPIIGSGGYAKNGVGGAVATGDGDFMMRFCPSFYVVHRMLNGSSAGLAAQDSIKEMAKVDKNFRGAVLAMDHKGNIGAACNGIEKFRFCVYSKMTRRQNSFRIATQRFEDQTKKIIKTYLRYRIYPNSLRRQLNQQKPDDAMILICAEFEERYHARFNSIVEEIKSTSDSKSVAELKEFFNAVALDLFPDCVRWGRIVALFSFSGCLCQVMCHSTKVRSKRRSIKAVESWLFVFMKRQINSWIFLSGGWNAFVQYFVRTDITRRRSDITNFAWFPITGIAIGLLTIARFFINRNQ